MNALIASGFCATSVSDFDAKLKFLETVWLPNVGHRDVVIVDNSDDLPKLKSMRVPLYEWPMVRVIEVAKNLGHVGSMLGKDHPKLAGWSMSWILPAYIAYCEGRDMIYIEADCLAFGDWEKQIYDEMEARKLLMAFGQSSPVAAVEQSLFVIKHEFILEAIAEYCNIPESDGKMLPEVKFQCMLADVRVGMFSLPGGRQRPLDFDKLPMYFQKGTEEELFECVRRGLIK